MIGDRWISFTVFAVGMDIETGILVVFSSATYEESSVKDLSSRHYQRFSRVIFFFFIAVFFFVLDFFRRGETAI